MTTENIDSLLRIGGGDFVGVFGEESWGDYLQVRTKNMVGEEVVVELVEPGLGAWVRSDVQYRLRQSWDGGEIVLVDDSGVGVPVDVVLYERRREHLDTPHGD